MIQDSEPGVLAVGRNELFESSQMAKDFSCKFATDGRLSIRRPENRPSKLKWKRVAASDSMADLVVEDPPLLDIWRLIRFLFSFSIV